MSPALWSACRRRARPAQPLDGAIPAGPSTADLVLLCSFGIDLEAERTFQQLRAGLNHAGFPGTAARHLIRTSGLLDLVSRNTYCLRRDDTSSPHRH
jgi:hypothetical protein